MPNIDFAFTLPSIQKKYTDFQIFSTIEKNFNKEFELHFKS